MKYSVFSDTKAPNAMVIVNLPDNSSISTKGLECSKEKSNIFPIDDKVKEYAKNKKLWIAFEYFPPKTQQGVDNLIERFGRMKRHSPIYYDVTWGAGGSTSDLTLDLCIRIQKEFNMTANMHLTCTNMDRSKLDHAIAYSKQNGIQNILALRGDPPEGQKDWKPVDSGFSCALDLVRYLREKEGNYFNISVAGYPEGHTQRIKKVEPGTVLTPDEEGRASTGDDGTRYVCFDSDFAIELAYLKEKQDAGAQMVVTQMFFDTTVFITFVKKCREAGIHIPIIPGIMCVTSYAGFKRMVSFCQTRVPKEINDEIEKIKDDAAKMKLFGVEFGTKMCKDLINSGVPGLHFYTLK